MFHWNTLIMRYLHFLNFELLFQCLLIVIYCYAVVIALIEVSIFYAILPVLLYFLISYISLSPPDEYSVTKVLGANRRAHLQQVNLSKKVGAQDFYPCIAYQAAALDCSEDALSAVKVVSIHVHLLNCWLDTVTVAVFISVLQKWMQIRPHRRADHLRWSSRSWTS